MASDSRGVFRVPKKTNQRILESLTTDTEQKRFLNIKLMEAFKKPDISKTNMQFSHFWSIKNTESELSYSKRRQSIKANNQSVLEYFGFLFVENDKYLNDYAKTGKLKIGNVPDSKLATGHMGVSLSQFSDIYHPGDSNCIVPNVGILLIVKYLKGKVNYVVSDPNPTEPQPNYDCHIVRNGNVLDANATSNKAFHSTQVFLYEYSEDLDIIDYPSQLVIIGAAKFKWTKSYIFRSISSKPPNVTHNGIKRRLPDSHSNEEHVPRKTHCKTLFSRFGKLNVNNDPVPLMSGDLTIGDVSSDKITVNVILMTKFKEPILLHNMTTPNWRMSDVIPNQNFFEFFHYLDEKKVTTTLKISTNTITHLPPNFYDGKDVLNTRRCKHVMYLNMIPSSLNDKKIITKLIDNLSTSGMVGRITTMFTPNILFYIFPSGKISDSLGIPRDDGAGLHVVLLFSVHPEIGSTGSYLHDEYTLVSLSNNYSEYLGKHHKPLVSQETLKHTVVEQTQLQKNLFKKMFQNKSGTRDESDMEIDSDSEKDCTVDGAKSRMNGSVPHSILKRPVGHIDPVSRPAPAASETHPLVTPLRIPDIQDIISMDSPNREWQHLTQHDRSDMELPDLSHIALPAPAPNVHHPTPHQSLTKVTVPDSCPMPVVVAPPNTAVVAHMDHDTLQGDSHEVVSTEPRGRFSLITVERFTYSKKRAWHFDPRNMHYNRDVNCSIYRG